MSETTARAQPATAQTTAFSGGAVLPILGAVSLCHLLNDLIQSLLPAIYPILKQNYDLSFAQIGFITLTFFTTASLLQPIVGMVTDRRPMPFSLPIGMGFSLLGLLLLSVAHNYAMLLLSAGLVGLGSSVFHPESSRVARMASGGRHGFAQSVFQVGGNTGTSAGPLLAAFIVVPRGQGSIAWFALVALATMGILTMVGRWYRDHRRATAKHAASAPATKLDRRTVTVALVVLSVLVFSKYFYLAGLNTYFTFYLIHKFGLSVQAAQVHLFIFLGAVAVGTLIGGPVGDRIGRRTVIWCSILGVLPFTLMLPHANLFWTTTLSVIIGVTIASAFSAIVVFAQELVPGRVGTIVGLFFGLAFGMGGLGAAALGVLADARGIDFVYEVCAFLPALGILAVFLPGQSAFRPATT
jgi:FSR family fosmidomycin resistance protein-like MFS transporter